MFKINRKVLFFVFALCLFTIGAKIGLLIENGFGDRNDIIFTILLLGPLIISSITIYNKLYKAIIIDHLNHPNFESDNQEPQILIDDKKNSIPVIWSNSISFQRFQRYIFGDIKPAKTEYIESLLKLISLYTYSSDGFLKRKERPELFQSNILGRLPPINTNSSLVSYLYKG